MGADPDEFQNFVVGLAVDEEQVRPDMALPFASPLSSESVVVVVRREGLVGEQLRHDSVKCGLRVR